MRLFTLKHKSMLLSLLALGSISLSAGAAIPNTAPYVTDPQNSHVEDATSQGLNTVNMVLCIIGSMDPSDMVNQGNYIALIDKNKCDASSQSSTSNSTSGASGASSAPNYMTAYVNVSRASNTDPMIVKAWMTLTEQGNLTTVYAYANATQSPTAAPPYGAMRVDFMGKVAGTQVFNGYVVTNGSDVQYYEDDNQGGNTYSSALAMNATSSDAASGTMTVPDYSGGGAPTMKTYNFAYDSNDNATFPSGVFRRDIGVSDECFDRSAANTEKSVWRYGTYNATDGTRVDQANPGFPVTFDDGTNSYFGYASYWGINFQGVDLNAQADGPITGTVHDQRPGNTTTYSLSKVSGKLTKWTQHTDTLAHLDGIPFFFSADLTNKTSDTTNVSGWNNWEMQWNNTAGNFTVIGKQDCSSGPCTTASITPAATVNSGVFNSLDISGWSDAFGGNINIPSTGSDHTGSDTMAYYSQSMVLPGAAGAPTALYCLNNCPTAASLTAFTGSNSPYDSNTATQWGTGNTQVSYTFDPTYGLEESSTPMIETNSSKLQGQYSFGIMTGRLYDTALNSGSCPGSATYCEPSNPSVYYTWQTGADQWNQSLWLTPTGGSTVVSFDPPELVSYTVPNDSATYGSWANKTLQLQFNGFGNLQGIPGTCVNPVDNSPTDCSTAGARYVPAFAIPDGATMTLTDGATTTPLIVKALDAELRLKHITGCTGVSLAQPSTAATLPDSTGLHDPSSSADSEYLGTKPTITDAPKVIQGVLQ